MLTVRHEYQISFDPGLTATGWALFRNGLIDSTGTIRPRGTVRQDKLFDLSSKLRLLFSDTINRFGSKARIAALEEWGSFSPSCRFQTMVACAEARGVLVAICFEYAEEVRYINKGKTPKTQATWLASKFGIKGSEHARDAAHLGMLAGFLG